MEVKRLHASVNGNEILRSLKDEEDLRLEALPEFWRMTEERRREPTVPLDEIKAEVLADA